MRGKSILICTVLTLALLLSACGSGESVTPAGTAEDDKPSETEGTTVTHNIPRADSSNLDEHAVTLQKETDQFIFYCAQADLSVLDDVIEILEGSFEWVTSALQVQVEDQVHVYIYPNLESFHSAIGRPNSPDWLVGTMVTFNSIKIVSPGNPGPEHDFDSILQVALHEYIHIVTNRVNAAAPGYLNEGIATYMARQSQGVREAVLGLLDQGKVPSIAELNILDSDGGIYQIGYAFADYIVNVHGYEKLIDLYKNPKDIEGVFGLDEHAFHADWVAYLKATY